MRSAFANALVRLADDDERIVLLTGDLGFSVLEPFAEKHPARFYNVGVAEQNMIGMSTGLAEAGFIPFAYSIATFASMRAYEFLRNGAVLHRLPVRVIGVGAGFDYGLNGVSHYALEDIALMRAQPGMNVIAPADREQAETALFATADLLEPIYFRVAKEGAPIPGLAARFETGSAHVIRDGDDVAFVALGNCAQQALEAAERLAATGVASSVVVVSSVKPAPVDDLVAVLERVPVALSVEAHYVVGGLGSLVAEVIAERGLDCRLVRCGPTDVPRRVGTPQFLYEAHGLDPVSLADRATAALAAPAPS